MLCNPPAAPPNRNESGATPLCIFQVVQKNDLQSFLLLCLQDGFVFFVFLVITSAAPPPSWAVDVLSDITLSNFLLFQTPFFLLCQDSFFFFFTPSRAKV